MQIEFVVTTNIPQSIPGIFFVLVRVEGGEWQFDENEGEGFPTFADAERRIPEMREIFEPAEYAIGARPGTTTALRGRKAEEFAEQFGGKDDRVIAPKFNETTMTATFAAVGDDGDHPVILGLGTSPEMAFAHAIGKDAFPIKDAQFLHFEPIGPEVQKRVQQGDVSWGRTMSSIAERELRVVLRAKMKSIGKELEDINDQSTDVVNADTADLEELLSRTHELRLSIEHVEILANQAIALRECLGRCSK